MLYKKKRNSLFGGDYIKRLFSLNLIYFTLSYRHDCMSKNDRAKISLSELTDVYVTTKASGPKSPICPFSFKLDFANGAWFILFTTDYSDYSKFMEGFAAVNTHNLKNKPQPKLYPLANNSWRTPTEITESSKDNIEDEIAKITKLTTNKPIQEPVLRNLNKENSEITKEIKKDAEKKKESPKRLPLNVPIAEPDTESTTHIANTQMKKYKVISNIEKQGDIKVVKLVKNVEPIFSNDNEEIKKSPEPKFSHLNDGHKSCFSAIPINKDNNHYQISSNKDSALNQIPPKEGNQPSQKKQLNLSPTKLEYLIGQDGTSTNVNLKCSDNIQVIKLKQNVQSFKLPIPQSTSNQKALVVRPSSTICRRPAPSEKKDLTCIGDCLFSNAPVSDNKPKNTKYGINLLDTQNKFMTQRITRKEEPIVPTKVADDDNWDD